MQSYYHQIVFNFICVLYLPINLITSLLVANTGVSLSMHISIAKWFFEAGRWTVYPSNNNKNSFHLISSLLQRKSFKNITSALSTPTHPHLSLAGFENVLKMISGGHRYRFLFSICPLQLSNFLMLIILHSNDGGLHDFNGSPSNRSNEVLLLHLIPYWKHLQHSVLNLH